MRVLPQTLAALGVLVSVAAQKSQVLWTLPSPIQLCPDATASWSWTIEPSPPNGSEVHWQLVKVSGGGPLDQGTGNSVTWAVRRVAVGDALVVKLGRGEESVPVPVVPCSNQPTATPTDTQSPTQAPGPTTTTAQETQSQPASSSATTTVGSTSADPSPPSDQSTTAAPSSSTPSQSEEAPTSSPISTTADSTATTSSSTSSRLHGNSTSTAALTTAQRPQESPLFTAVTVTRTLLPNPSGNDSTVGRSGHSGLSSGGIAGVVIGVLLGVSALVGLGVFLAIRHHRRDESDDDAVWSPISHSNTTHSHYMREPPPLVPSLPPSMDPFYAVDRSQPLSPSGGVSDDFRSPAHRY